MTETGVPSIGITTHPSIEGSPFTSCSDGAILHQFDWNTELYLNIVVCNLTDYAGFSSSPVLDLDCGFDGITISYKYFLPSFWDGSDKQGKTLVHEFGHYMGLLHVFQQHGLDVLLDQFTCDDSNGNCAYDGDFICDTPPCLKQSSPDPPFEEYTFWGCVIPAPNTCTIENPDLPDPISNYMHYNFDNCLNEFTYDQRAMMIAASQSLRPGFYGNANICMSDGNCGDGFMNNGELGVDCGGTCPPCYSPVGDCNAGMPDYFMPDTSNHNWGCNWIRYRQITNCLRGNLDGTYRMLYYEKAVIGSDDFYYSGGKTYVNAAIPSGLSGGWCWYSSDMPYIHLTPGFGIFASEDDEMRIGLAYVGNPAWWNGSCEGEPCPSSVPGERVGQEEAYEVETSAARTPSSAPKVNSALYPNPTTGLITYTGSGPLSTATVMDLMGRTLHTQACNGTTTATLDLSPYHPGTYLLRMQYTIGKAETHRVVRQ